MHWRPIVAGVDYSDEGVRAAVMATELAEVAKTQCYLVHAVRDPWTEASLAEIPLDLADQNRLVLESARTLVVEELREKVPAPVLERLDTRFGPAPIVLAESADDHDAEIVVLGGKHHSTIGRWLAGSTVHHMVRTMDRPLFVTGPSGPGTPGGKLTRVLAAVDLSSAAAPTLDAAERFAKLFHASLRVLHVVEPLPLIPELPVGMESDVLRRSEEELERTVWPRITLANAERLVRTGPAAETIANVASEWHADLIVVGSHGRGWVDRILIGSVTERLLNRLPTSMLVIPVAGVRNAEFGARSKARAIGAHSAVRAPHSALAGKGGEG